MNGDSETTQNSAERFSPAFERRRPGSPRSACGSPGFRLRRAGAEMRATPERRVKGLRQFLQPDEQRDWIEGGTTLQDAGERTESIEQRFRYAPRFQKLLGRPQARQVLDLLAIYGRTCLPIPRRTERYYWSASCLPSTSDKPLVRVNASWMELFTIYADGDGIRARFLVHLSDFTTDRSPLPERLDLRLLETAAGRPDDVGHFLTRAEDMFGITVGLRRGADAGRNPHVRRAIRRFNLTHVNRGRNAYRPATATAWRTAFSTIDPRAGVRDAIGIRT